VTRTLNIKKVIRHGRDEIAVRKILVTCSVSLHSDGYLIVGKLK